MIHEVHAFLQFADVRRIPYFTKVLQHTNLTVYDAVIL